MLKKMFLGVLFAVLILALLIAGINFNVTKAVDYSSSGILSEQGTSDSSWPTFHYDICNTGYTQDLVVPPLVLNWTFDTDGEITGHGIGSSPAVAKGIVFIGSDDNNIYALNATNGALIWKYRTGDWVRSTPAVVNHVVYVASQDGYVYALYANNGTLKWKYGPAGGFQLSSPTVKNGRLYVASVPTFAPGGPCLIALNVEEGTKEWEIPLSSQSTPAVADGIVYIGSDKVYAFNESDGSIIWQYDYYDLVNHQDEFFNTSPAVESGIIYIASGYTSGRIHALNATTGEVIWRQETGYPSFSSPAIAHGMVYIGSYTNYNIYALDTQTGAIRWKYHTQGYIDSSSPAIANETVYVCSNDGYLYALNVTSGRVMARYPVNGGTSPAVAEGKIFVGSHDGNLYCLATSHNFIPSYPIASFTCSPSVGIARKTIVFNASKSKCLNGTITDYYWDFGDGTYDHSSLATITHIFNSCGNYSVTLTVFSDSGLASSETKMIAVMENRVDANWCETGVPYRAVDGLTVTLHSFEIIEKTGSYQYVITYTLTNNNPDKKIMEGAFKLYYRDESGGLPQYGFFNYLFPGDSITRSYTFEELNSKLFDVLEYHHDNFFSEEPLEDSLKWKVVYPDYTPPITEHNYDDTWRKSDFTITVTATDNINRVDTYYKINDGPFKIVSIDGQPFIITEGVNNTLEYWSIDWAGNEEFPHKFLTGIKLDKTPTLIGDLSHIPKDDVQPDQQVKVSVNVTDFMSDVKNVTLSYNLNDSDIWIDLPMTLNSTTGLYETIISGQQANTLVKYRIAAYDNAGNYKVEDNSGEYYVYIVVPEFPSTVILTFIMLLSAIFIVVKKHLKWKI